MKNSNEPIVFWTEAGQGIGMGHLCRSLVIAREFFKSGKPCLFVINNDLSARDRLNAEGFPFEFGNLEGRELPSILDNTPKTVIFDSKKDVTSLIPALKRSGHKIILLDNVTPARLYADMVIYPSPLFVDNLDWTGFKGHVYSGARYVPVDETYLKARNRCRMLKHQLPYRMLVTMGGGDTRQLTYQVVSSLFHLPQPVEIKVVIGPAFIPDTRLIELERENDPRLQFITRQNNLASLMADSHIAITAVGITLYELAAVGVPAIVIANYSEDHRDMELLAEMGFNQPLGFYQDIAPSHIQEAVSRLIQDATAWQNMREKGWQLLDGFGAQRIVECILGNSEGVHR